MESIANTSKEDSAYIISQSVSPLESVTTDSM